MRDVVPLYKTTHVDLRPRAEGDLYQLDKAAVLLLNHLRIVALGCRAAARADLFEACAVLSTTDVTSKNAYAETLMKCLAQALEVEPVFYRPGVAAISFDEAWLLKAVQSAGDQDWNSFQFLLRSRVPFHTRRNVASLIVSVSEHFSTT